MKKVQGNLVYNLESISSQLRDVVSSERMSINLEEALIWALNEVDYAIEHARRESGDDKMSK